MEDNDDSKLDKAWITKNFGTLLPASIAFFNEQGRGALVINHQKNLETNAPVYYIPEAALPEGDEETRRMTQAYNPMNQIVVVLLKPGGRSSSYRIGLNESGSDGDTTESRHGL